MQIHPIVERPHQSDIDAAWILANKIQAAIGLFIAPTGALQRFEAIHNILVACPRGMPARSMWRSAVALARFGELVFADTASRETLKCSAAGSRPSAELRAEQILEWVLAAHATASLTLRDISATLGVREQYLSESLNRISNHTFLDHLHAVRALRASVMLSHRQGTVKDIARATGYVCPSQLNRHFKHFLYMTPTRFRWLCQSHFAGSVLKPNGNAANKRCN